MMALPNAHSRQGGSQSLLTGQQSGLSPEKTSSIAEDALSGVSVRYAPKPGHQWFVLRATYGREIQAFKYISANGGIAFIPRHYELRVVGRKRKWQLTPLVPQFLFLYSTPEEADKYVKDTPELHFLTYYYNHFATGAGGYNPPLVVPYDEMLNFIRVTSVDNVHTVRVTPDQVHYKSGDTVRIISGDFAGVIGKVARAKGQQRVIVELKDICLIATAYIPTAYLEKI